jgi:hypothetical protein
LFENVCLSFAVRIAKQLGLTNELVFSVDKAIRVTRLGEFPTIVQFCT